MNSYHDREVLHETMNGYVLHCSICKDFQITFGNMLLIYSKEGFYNFRNYINELYNNTQDIVNPYDRNIYMRIEDLNFGYCLNKEELKELKELVEMTVSTVNVNTLLKEVFEK